MDLEVINNKIKHGYIYIVQIMNYIYIGSGENANNKCRLYTHSYELFIKVENGEPLTRKLFKAIQECILDISLFYDVTKISCIDFLNAIKIQI